MKKPSPPPYPIYAISDLRDLLLKIAIRYPDRVALQSKKNGAYSPLYYREISGIVAQLAGAFSECGLRKGDRVALLSHNSTEWVLSYLATVTSGLVAVPIDKDLTAQEICHVLRFSKSSVVICSEEYIEPLREKRRDIPSVSRIVSMGEERTGADLSFLEFRGIGSDLLHTGQDPFQYSAITGKDLAALIFTSGTTGNSKGVMLNHKNLVANIMATSQYVSIGNGVLLSVLPLHHTYECMAGFLVALYQGCTIFHAESLRRIPENLRETQPTAMIGVPLLFESLYKKIESGIKKKGSMKFRMAKIIATFSEYFFRQNLRRVLFKPIHDQLGGRLELVISGGAAGNPQTAQAFRELGINFLQGYGLTEASPIVAVNRVDYLKDNSVGLPLQGLDIKIVKNEILVRGPSVMTGYYLNKEATEESLVDGWLHTGDLGYIDEDGFLYISGRKKSVIVTSNGKNVYPEEVEAVLNQSPYILESLVWGGPEKDPARVTVQAIVVPCIETFDDTWGLGQHDKNKIREVIGIEIKKRSKELARYKHVKSFVIRSEEFDKTTTRKIKRYLYTGVSKSDTHQTK
ncbi:MAG: AMP-binding protein [Acidobacteriota bacterium]|nr:AMP-binding protein [Acidobacteriota bacterium]